MSRVQAHLLEQAWPCCPALSQQQMAPTKAIMKARKNYYTKAIRVLETTNSTTGKANMQVQRNAASPATNPTCFCRKKNTVLPKQACSGQQGLREGWTVSRAWPGHELLLDNGTSRTTTRLLHY